MAQLSPSLLLLFCLSDDCDDIFEKVSDDAKDILEKVSDDGDDIFEQAGAELGQAQLKLELKLGFT